MDWNEDHGKWFINPAPGMATGYMATPGVVLCSVCGRDIVPTEDCLERCEYEFRDPEHIDELAMYLCEQCWEAGKG